MLPHETVPPVEAKINALIETSWWNQVHRKGAINLSKAADGTKHYVCTLTIKTESGLFYTLPEDHPEYPGMPGIQLTTAEGARMFIKDVNKDTDYTEYTVTGWKPERWCDMWFTLKNFTPEAGVEYEMVFCFMSSGNATNPYTLHYVYTDNRVVGNQAK